MVRWWRSRQPRNDAVFRDALYVRLNPPLPKEYPLDTAQPEQLRELKGAAERWLGEKQTRAALAELR